MNVLFLFSILFYKYKQSHIFIHSFIHSECTFTIEIIMMNTNFLCNINGICEDFQTSYDFAKSNCV